MTSSKTEIDLRSNSPGGSPPPRPYLSSTCHLAPPSSQIIQRFSTSPTGHKRLTSSQRNKNHFSLGRVSISTNNPQKFIKSPPSLSPAIISCHSVNGQPHLAALVVNSPGVRVLRKRNVVRESTLPGEQRVVRATTQWASGPNRSSTRQYIYAPRSPTIRARSHTRQRP
jgi:hypothetical protein